MSVKTEPFPFAYFRTSAMTFSAFDGRKVRPARQPPYPKRDKEAAENDEGSIDQVDGKARKNTPSQYVNFAAVKYGSKNAVRGGKLLVGFRCNNNKENMTNKEIARKLSLTLHTVENHVSNLYFKTRAKDRRELARL